MNLLRFIVCAYGFCLIVFFGIVFCNLFFYKHGFTVQAVAIQVSLQFLLLVAVYYTARFLDWVVNGKLK